MNKVFCIALLATFGIFNTGMTQTIPDKGGTDSTTPLHLLQSDYPTPYGKTTVDDITEILVRIHDYLNATTPMKLVNPESNEEVKNYKKPGVDAIFKPGDFRLISYEWGVTYAGMLLAGEVTDDQRFTNYTQERLKFIADLVPYYNSQLASNPDVESPLHSVLQPGALDDAGAMCAAMIKAKQNGFNADLQPLIENYIDYISNDQFRLTDGTLARNRPKPNTLWLDDLFMSIPALAQMGKLTGDRKYYDDAVKQVLQFSERMFVEEKGLFIHGWVQDMRPHPEFHWGRANGWAIMAIVELLEVLPEDHPKRNEVMDQLRAHIKGLSKYQSGNGLWHQLLDRNDTYLETSCTAIFTYSIARAINNGWVNKEAYGPMVLLAWNAVATKVNKKGQVEGTCVGTGMGFDPAFYYHRPINVYAAHSYGPVLLAGAEMIRFLKDNEFEINDSAVQFLED